MSRERVGRRIALRLEVKLVQIIHSFVVRRVDGACVGYTRV